MILRFVFILCAVLALICFGFGVTVKHRNIGFLVTTALLIVCDIVCFFVMGSTGIGKTREYLSIYYICHAWLYFSTLLMVIIMSGGKLSRFLLIPSGLFCLYQTGIIVSNFLGNKSIVFSKRIMFGSLWWIAEKSDNSPVAFGFGTFRGLLFDTAIVVIIALIIGIIKTAKVFRTKYYVLIAAQIIFSIFEFFSQKYKWPVWILCLFMTPICIGVLFIVNYYPDRKLRAWSLTRFANEMSDGFILYNEYDDPLYLNDVLRDTLTDEMIELFKDKKNLDEWIAQTINIDGLDVLICGNETGEIYYKAHKMELKEKKHYIGTIYILHNTTDSILRLGAMQEANIELERAAKMKSDFLANMSHEIRTPMNAVIGMAEIAMREDLPPKVVDYLVQIQNSGKNLLNIINDILDYSKIEAGKMEIITGAYEPLSEINDIANILSTRIGDKDISLFVAADASIPNMLEGDAMRIRQVIINIANNAIKFTQQGIVAININCERTSDTEVLLTYHITDTGQGIKEEDLGKLFESFQQVDSKRNRNVEGTGLGLAISQRLIEAMGGKIGVTSEYGKGSDFYFSIPQKIVDETRCLVVKDAGNKYAYCLDEKSLISEMFEKEISNLGVEGVLIRSLDLYKPTGKKDFLFFTYESFDEEIKAFLKAHPKLTGVVLVDFDSDFKTDIPNLRVMKKPQTSLTMVMTLNNEAVRERGDSSKAFEIDFTAPQAKILIVDDNEINITIAEGLIAPLKAKTYGANSGKSAINMLSKEKFDVILMDHMMPEMDGIETTKIIRDTVPSAKETPIIALTANVLEGAKEMFIKAGMNDFVAKPIDVRTLITKLKEYIPSDKIKVGEAHATASEAKEIPVIGDLDTQTAITMIGNETLFFKILKEYYRVINAKADKIRESYSKEDWETYTIDVHALKSSSKQIGAMELSEMAADLEQAGKDRNIDYIREHTEHALEKYLAYEPVLAGLFAEEENAENAEDKPEADKNELLALIESIYEITDNLDFDALEEVSNKINGFSYPDDQKEFPGRLKAACEDMDFDLANTIANEWKEKLK